MRFRVPQKIRALTASACAAAAGLLIVLVTLAALGFGRGDDGSFGQSIKSIVAVVYDRSILPRPPSAYARPPESIGESLAGARSWIQTLIAATPILLTGLAVAVAFKASVLNIGAEGQYVAGAIAATAVGLSLHSTSVVNVTVLLVGSAVGGAMIAGIAATLERWRRVPVVLGTLLLNFVAVVLLKALLQGPLHERGAQLQSDQLPEAARLAHVSLAGIRTQLHVGLFIALAAAAAVAFILRLTTFGFRLRATGDNADAARFAGIAVNRVAVLTLCLSGALAGLAGGIQTAGVPPYLLLPDTGTAGFGFTGIAVALLGRLSPLGVVAAALFFGWLQTAFAALQSELHVPFLALQATQGAILLTMLVATGVRPRWTRGVRKRG